MEGAEDIPGAALSEGVRFNWTDFSSYMAALAAMQTLLREPLQAGAIGFSTAPQ
jgi:N-acyl-D-aspartate/D-glutamate deacylase